MAFTIQKAVLCSRVFHREDAAQLVLRHENFLTSKQTTEAKVVQEEVTYTITQHPKQEASYCLTVAWQWHSIPVRVIINLPKEITTRALLQAYSSHQENAVRQFEKRIAREREEYINIINKQRQE